MKLIRVRTYYDAEMKEEGPEFYVFAEDEEQAADIVIAQDREKYSRELIKVYDLAEVEPVVPGIKAKITD